MNYINTCIQLAKKGVGYVSPNPLVGAVLVKNKKVIATGYHRGAGKPHAEIIAIKKAGRLAKGSVLYVNLEPCCHVGKTGACTKEIIKAGIKEVYISTLDPNPLVSGKGKKELEKNNIKVIVEEEKEKALILNEIFFKFIKTKKPFIAVKWAMSLDGKIATQKGDSKWISNNKSRQIVHNLRHKYDAVLVGVNTVLKDNPRLTVRLKSKKNKNPIKIILDSTGKINTNSKIFKDPASLIIATTEKIKKHKEEELLNLGVKIIKTKSKNNQVNLKELFLKSGRLDITSILVEGGGEVIASVLKEKLADKVYIFIANKIIGGREAKTPVEGSGIEKMSEALKLKITKTQKIEENIFVEAYPNL